MMRYVVCKSGNGKVISDGHCDRELKPLTVQPCGAPNCLAHWVEQEWERVNEYQWLYNIQDIICISSCDSTLMQAHYSDATVYSYSYIL